MSEEDAEKLFLQEKPALALLFIGLTEKTYASVISKEIDSTFAHTTRILSKMEDCGIIRFTYKGRIKFVELTEYGKKVEVALKEFRDLLQKAAPSIEGSDTRNENTKASSVLSGSFVAGREAMAFEVSRERVTSEAEAEKRELDPQSAEILEKIEALYGKIEEIYKAALEKGEDRASISRKLGPFSRDIGMLQALIEETEERKGAEGGTPIDSRVKPALEKTLKYLEACLRN
ncbi:MAG: MarR family transcriptional regulator [Methanosarcinaceae archaeon]|nr:MarR family transcriptional regulator [Methanosarcinaceae archaeon]MDD4331209.1 MarR family transcriptional regulator [Methanosarcinaceae archaeon]MDD4749584.1 MarR family transcriptional regulator [Methanosarcinaceae archaeon]